METVSHKKPLQPMTMAELLPQLSGIIPKNSSTLKCSIQSAASCSKQSAIKPMTMAEIQSHLTALRGPKRQQQQSTATSTTKKRWNSCVKVDNKSGQMRKNNIVRKVLDFQPDLRQQPPPGSTTRNPESNIKPGCRAKKSIYLAAQSSVRISGVCKIPETPLEMKPVKKISTLANKENIPNKNHVNRKTMITAQPVSHYKQAPTIFTKPVSYQNQKPIIISKPVSQKKLVTKVAIPGTPELNHSWKSSCDSSFLQTEKEIHDMEEKSKPLTEEHTLERIVEVSPPLSNPFMDYRNVKENFNDTSNIDTSAAIQDDTIMCFEKQSNNNEVDSDIISLCDLLNKVASIENPNTHQKNTELNKLLDEEKKMLNNIEVLENGIKLLTEIKSSQLKLLTTTQKSIKQLGIKNNENSTIVEMVNSTPKRDKVREPEQRSIFNRSLVNKSPTYKIPKRNSCLRKEVFHKSPVNKSPTYKTPDKNSCSRKEVFHKSPVNKSPTYKTPDKNSCSRKEVIHKSSVNKSPKYKTPNKNSCLRKELFHKSLVNKSPTYKIPHKNSYLRKEVFHKSMPSISSVDRASPQSGNGNKALSMYMEMKEQMTFLNTPIVKNRQHRVMDAPDTPAVTSRNLQHQLDKLFNES